MSRLAQSATLLFVIVVVLMLVIPMPTPLLDVLILVNLSVSLVVTAAALNVRRPLEFSTFPALLLLTTLFRVALNVSSARLILLQANAGTVIQAFGDFVVGANPVVGFIVFLLLFIVQFMVITRGAERVSEVTARFTLDAMPGKQMAIDADLHAGVLTEQEARARRAEIAREADFYGAMDGAAKFVRGDAIATLIILIVNAIGGLAVGVLMQHDSLGDAVSTYTILSVGDALVSQLPALLLSTATGLIVTRAGSGEDEFGRALMGQLFAQRRPLYLVAGLMALLPVFTPVSPIPALAIAGLLAYLASRVPAPAVAAAATARAAPAAASARRPGEPSPQVPQAEAAAQALPDPLALEFGYGLLSLADPARGGDLMARVTQVRTRLAEELGFLLPRIKVRDNVSLPPQTYVLRQRGVEVARGEVMADRLLAMGAGAPDLPGIAVKDPVFGLPAVWISRDRKDQAVAQGYAAIEPSAVIATHLADVGRKRAHELLRREDVRAFLDRVRAEDPAVVDELYPSLLGLGTIHHVLQNLLREGVPIRDGVTVCESLADAAAVTKDPEALTEAVRRGLSRQITEQVAGGQKLVVVTLDPALEQDLVQKLTRGERGTVLSLDVQTRGELTSRLHAALQGALAQGRRAAVLTAPLLRPHLRRILERVLSDVPVLAFGELDADTQLESGGVVSLS